jgi:hypothetical protein
VLAAAALTAVLLTFPHGGPGGPGGSGGGAAASGTAPATGAPAPAPDLTDVRTGRAWARATGRHGASLVSFLATQPDTTDSASRRQAVGLVSMATQFTADGLRVAIVDDTPGSGQPNRNALINTSYDWRLGAVALLDDPGHRLARSYAVTGTPTTVLLDGSGRLVARWDGQTLTATLSSAITRALGLQASPAASATGGAHRQRA